MSLLAIEGGEPTRDKPFAPWPYYDNDEIDSVEEVLRSGKVNYWTGEIGREFEKKYASCCGRKYGVAVANGSLALELALIALGIGEGDEVITSPRTFIASASSISLRGAIPVFADVDPISQNITAGSIEKVITPRTKAIIAVHLAGWPCEMDQITELAAAHGLRVIEDCAQANGSLYRGSAAGSFGDIAAFSFCQDKIVTTGGEGGMFLTDNEALWRRAWSYKDHGKNWDAVYNREHAPGFRWLHESIGTNWRMTEMQAAIGCRQLEKLESWVDARRKNAALLNRELADVPGLRLTVPPEHIKHSYYKYYLFVEQNELAPDWDRDRVMTAICAEGIPCYSGSCGEVYLEKAFADLEWQERRQAVSARLAENSLMFLVHPTLDEADMMDTSSAIKKVMKAAAAT